ncbi:MAG: hypothetical protein RI906_14 [Pseudomonadota bacterium]|jgi:hypothetical protein
MSEQSPTRHRVCHSAHSQSGVATVELAFVASLLLALSLGIAEFGRALYTYDALVKSARSASRYLSTNIGPESLERTRCLAVYGIPLSPCEPSIPPLIEGLALDQVRIDLPFDLRASNGTLLLPATPGLSALVARDAAGFAVDGNLDLVTVTIGPADSPFRFSPLLPFVLPAIRLGPVSSSMPLAAF